MTNNILRLEQDPDTDEWLEVYMTDEEWQAAFHPEKPNQQILRDKIAEMRKQQVKEKDIEARLTALEKIVEDMRKAK